MKLRLFVSFGIITALLAGIVFVRPTNAEVVVTKESIANIKANCFKNLASLRQLHQTDAFLRNDRGELYQTISNKLMTPLNQRLVENELDGSLLVATAASFNRKYRNFYKDYVEYDNAMSGLLEVDCSDEPVTFYTSLLETRKKRAELDKSDQALVSYVVQYKKQFDTLRPEFEAGGKL